MRRSKRFRVVALVAAFNEGDIISFVIRHLVEDGIEVYLIDNRSTDDTIAQATPWLGRGLRHIETFPADGGAVQEEAFDWTAILRRKEELTREIDADWFIHHDADEIRQGPWEGLTLKDSIAWVSRLGFNAIDFQVKNFRPVDNGFHAGVDPEEYFAFYEDAAEFDKLQVKCWKSMSTSVSLVPSGGHDATFDGRRVFPVKFLVRHYPIRSQEHGTRKVFGERKPRFLPEEADRGWHVQYNAFSGDRHDFIRDPSTLKRFDLDQVRLELLLQSQGSNAVPQPKDVELTHWRLENDRDNWRRLALERETRLREQQALIEDLRLRIKTD